MTVGDRPVTLAAVIFLVIRARGAILPGTEILRVRRGGRAVALFKIGNCRADTDRGAKMFRRKECRALRVQTLEELARYAHVCGNHDVALTALWYAKERKVDRHTHRVVKTEFP